MVTPTLLPVFPVHDSVDGMDYAVRRTLADLDISKLDNWFDPEICAEEALGPMLRFLDVGDLDTEIFGVAFRRAVYAHNSELREFRGSDHVLELYHQISGIAGRYDLTPATGIPTGIHFTVNPPPGIIPFSNWQGILRRAYRWLLPPYLNLDTFTVGLQFDATHYHRAAFKLRHRIK